MEILPLKKTDAQSIYSVLLDWLKKKDLQCNKLVGMGFDGAATFAGRKSGVQAYLKRHAPHSVFVHCHCHKLQLACVQSANRTEGIKHMYTTLTTLWNFFSLFTKEMSESERDTESTIPSWLFHEKCVKKCYGVIVSALESIYQESHELEALGISKILLKPSTLFTIYLLDYILPEVSKLSKSLQTEKLDLS